MGSFVFKWEHPASEVYVTGTFDEWKKTEKLDKVGNHFEKLVKLNDASKKIDYKFVVDGEWTTNHTAPKEIDESGNENNVLTPEHIIKEAPATTAMMSSAAPESTTAALAADAPLEKKKEQNSDLPGTFPETPAVDAGNQELGISPMPAVPGAVNPVQLAPGEKIPEHLTSGSTTTDNVALDPKSYMTPDEVAAAAFLSSAAPASTTAALAAEAPLEKPSVVDSVPAVVKDSQAEAHAAPEASANAAEVKEKANLEHELLEKVQEAPSTSEGTAGKGTEKTEKTVTAGEAAASVAAAATALGGAALAGAIAAKDAAADKASAAATSAQASATEAATQLPDSVKGMLPESVQSAIGTTSTEQKIQEVSPEVPTEVKQSIVEAGESPEAASSTAAVAEKKVMEAELLKEVKPTENASDASKPAETEVSNKASENAGAEGATAAPASTDAGSPSAATNGASTAATTIDPTTPAKPAAEAEAPTSPTIKTEESTKTDESTNGAASVEKKKKNRLSTFLSKFKPKKST